MQKIKKRINFTILVFVFFITSVMGIGLVKLNSTAPAHAAGGQAVVTAKTSSNVVTYGGQFSVDFSMNNTSGNSVYALDFLIGYDVNSFEYIDYSINEELLILPYPPALSKDKDGVKFAPEAKSSDTLRDEQYHIATFVFKVNDTATTGDYAFDIIDLAVATIDIEVASAEIPSSAVSTSVKVQSSSAEANLASIEVKSNGTPMPYVLNGTTYTVTNPVPYSAKVTITPVASDKSTIKIDGKNAVSGQETPISLIVGENTLLIEVTAEDGTTTKTYKLVLSVDAPKTDNTLIYIAISLVMLVLILQAILLVISQRRKKKNGKTPDDGTDENTILPKSSTKE